MGSCIFSLSPLIAFAVPLDDYSQIFSGYKFENASGIQQGSIRAGWAAQNDLVIQSITPQNNSNWFTFPQQPFTLKYMQNPTIYRVPFQLHLPTQVCNEIAGITINCVNNGDLIIPVTIEASLGDKTFSNVVNMEIITNSPQNYWQMFVFGIVAIIIGMLVVSIKRR